MSDVLISLKVECGAQVYSLNNVYGNFTGAQLKTKISGVSGNEIIRLYVKQLNKDIRDSDTIMDLDIQSGDTIVAYANTYGGNCEEL